MQVVIKNLSKNYGRHAALNGISLTINSGMFGLLGPNGAGKSTLMRILATLLPPSSGTATVGGYDVVRDQQEVRRLLGYLPQEFGLYKKLSGWEFLDLVGSLKGLATKRRRMEQVERVLRQVNLWQQRNQKLASYSGGMKRRLGIAQALLADPQLLIADEPTAGLDPEERIRFRNLLTELSSERVVLLSTHIVGDVESSCNQLAVLLQGELLFSGDQPALMAQAEGKVWQVSIPERDLQRLSLLGKVVATRRDGEELLVRMVSADNPLGAGKLVQPALEDGYMALIAASEGGER
ncbi:MAG: ABC transporter ATP-binding protein [Bacillota bacterium]|jgi:ABC-2 type transport system ATP-binding protein